MKRVIDLIGKIFGRWTVICKSTRKTFSGVPYWLCKCVCGKEKEVLESNLKNGHTKGCGCFRPNFKDLIGKRFGRWVVTRKAGKSKDGNFYWLCKCDCGNEKEVKGSSLISGNTKSCGCYNKEQTVKKHRIEYSLAAKRQVYRTYLINAKKRNFLFELSFDNFIKLSQKNCHYCGRGPSNICIPLANNGSFAYQGIDRIDSTKGYITENIIPCCIICNRAKGDMSYGEFIEWINELVDNEIWKKVM